jgi:hypothetical protein
LRTRIVVGIALVMLVIGVALGSIAIPMTKTETTTQLSSITTTVTQNLIRPTTTTLTLNNSYSAYTITEKIIPIVIMSETSRCGFNLTLTNSTTYIFPSNSSHYFNATIYTTIETSPIIISNGTTTTLPLCF